LVIDDFGLMNDNLAKPLINPRSPSHKSKESAVGSAPTCARLQDECITCSAKPTLSEGAENKKRGALFFDFLTLLLSYKSGHQRTCTPRGSHRAICFRSSPGALVRFGVHGSRRLPEDLHPMRFTSHDLFSKQSRHAGPVWKPWEIDDLRFWIDERKPSGQHSSNLDHQIKNWRTAPASHRVRLGLQTSASTASACGPW
jgi:hypothetical protein